MLENYRTSRNFNEIVKILHHSASDKKAFLWQNQDKSRFVFPIKDLVVNERFNTFVVKIAHHHYFKLKSESTTYAKFTYKDTVFKVQVISKISDNVSLSLPHEVKALELRSDYRHRFKPSDQKSVTLKISVELIIDATQELQFQVIDISHGGISIVVSDKDIKYFEDGSVFELIRLQDDNLEEAYNMEFVYAQKFRFKSQGRVQSAYKVGLKNLGSFDKDHIINYLG